MIVFLLTRHVQPNPYVTLIQDVIFGRFAQSHSSHQTVGEIGVEENYAPGITGLHRVYGSLGVLVEIL